MAPSGHQAKRPYAGTHSQNQSQITSFFPATAITHTTRSAKDAAPVLAPTLPAHVQSSLLNVGMRVRKSVPEGYKTGTYSSFKLFSDSVKEPVTAEIQVPAKQPQRTYRAAELAPFCGIMKVGGMSQQVYEVSQDDVPAEDEVPFLSQGSTISDMSMDEHMGKGKRRFEEEGDEPFVFGERLWMDEPPSPKSRPMAMPRSRKAKGGVAMKGTGGGGDMDFEDASFLDYEGLADDVMEDI